MFIVYSYIILGSIISIFSRTLSRNKFNLKNKNRNKPIKKEIKFDRKRCSIYHLKGSTLSASCTARNGTTIHIELDLDTSFGNTDGFFPLF